LYNFELSFDYTGVCSRNNLHSVLKHIIETDNPINNYLDDEKPADEIDEFNGDDAAFDDEGEVLIDQMDQLIDELDDESIDESYEDLDESVSNESENEESENENEEQNKENTPKTSATSAKRKQRRQAAANENGSARIYSGLSRYKRRLFISRKFNGPLFAIKSLILYIDNTEIV
jgi:hypothetical protein